MKLTAYAVKRGSDDTQMVLRTTSPTLRGAIVNYLVTYEKKQVTNRMTDQDIIRVWLSRQHMTATLHEVEVTVGEKQYVVTGDVIA